jgi:hypothetical protein
MNHYFFSYALLVIGLFTGSNDSYAQKVNFRNSVSIVQGNKTFQFSNLFDSVKLNRDSFAIIFQSKKYNEKKKKWFATQIAAITCDSCVTTLKPGQPIEAIPFFSEGTGLAAEDFGYQNLFIDNEAHHYITYTDQKDRRAEYISENGDYVKLRWNISLAYYNDLDVEFSKLPVNQLYLVLINDDNLNKVADEDEMLIVLVSFE